MKPAVAIATLLAAAPAVAAPTPTADDLARLWQTVQTQQAEIAELRAELKTTREALVGTNRQITIAEERLDATAQYMETAAVPDTTTRIGGYGEMHYNNLDTDAGGASREIDNHRYVLFVNHTFTDRIKFYSELEVEHALVGDGAPGEVEVEQAYVEFDLDGRHYARGGLFLVPIGILNETHEPTTFYGVERNDVESIIIPSTWWEGGAAMRGYYDNGISWDLAVHSGLATPVTGGDAFRIRSGRQKVAESTANDLAWTGRVKYTGYPGLELSASWHHELDASQVAGDGLGSADLLSAHGIFTRGPFTLRALWAHWDLSGDAVKLAGADQQNGWYVEPSFRLAAGATDWGFYGRYEYLDGARSRDQFKQWEVGFNFWPHDQVVVKADWRSREHRRAADRGRDFDGFDLGIGFQF
ncbi:MAG: hypothetical protein R3E84_10030 [Pseudomonadales bacterium]